MIERHVSIIAINTDAAEEAVEKFLEADENLKERLEEAGLVVEEGPGDNWSWKKSLEASE